MAQVWNNDGNYYYDDALTDASGNALPAAGTTNWGDWLGNNGIASARGYTKLNNYMGDLSKNYGLGEQDFIKAFQSYGVNYQPTANEYANTAAGFGNDRNMPWWGEDAMLRALGTGLDTVNPNAAYKGSWQSLWNQGNENTQQASIGNQYDKMQDAYGVSSNFMNDIPTILAGLGAVVGAGGLAGAFGGASSGLGAGADVIGSDFAAGVGGSLGGVPADIATSAATAGGTAAPGWTSGADLPVVDGGLVDATWGSGLRPDAAAATNTGGNNMDWTDFFTNDPGANASSFTDAWNGAMNSGGSDWATLGQNADGSLNTAVMNGGSNAASGSSLLSTLRNAPTSLLKSMFGLNDADAASMASLIGKGVGGLLDYNASSSQADALKAIADRSWAAGQPYRDRANAAMTPGFDVKSIPGLSSAMGTATETYLRKLSATNGNPTGIGAAPSQTEAFVLGNVALPAWQNYFNANSNAGGLSNLSAQANTTATQAAGADAAQYGSLAQTARNIFDPQPDNSRYLNLLAKQFGLV